MATTDIRRIMQSLENPMKKSKQIFFVNLVFCFFSTLFIIAIYLVYKRNLQTPLMHFGSLSLIFAILSLTFLLSLGWSLENKIKLLLITTSVFTSFFIAETFLYFIDINQFVTEKAYREKIAKKLGITFDSRNKFQIFYETASQRKTIWPNISPQYFVENEGIDYNAMKLFPLSAGIALVPTILCNESGSFSSYKSDEHGFNNPHETYRKKLDILMVGDSFTHGACVNEGEDIASHFRQRTTLNTLNLGNSGVGPLIELAILTEYGTHLKPKKVFWLYFEGNDLADLIIESQSSFLLSYLDDNFSQDLFYRQEQVDKALAQYIEENKKEFLERYNPTRSVISVSGVLKLQNLRRIFKLNALKQDDKSFFSKGLFELILKTAKKRVNSWGGELIFVYLPELERYKTKNTERFNQLHHKADVIKALENFDIKMIDLDLAFQKHGDPISLFPLRIEGHYTSEGYQLVANEIAENLKV